MTVLLPEADATVLARRAEIVAVLRRLVSADAVIDDVARMRPYESDALTAYRINWAIALAFFVGQALVFAFAYPTATHVPAMSAPKSGQ